MKHIIYGSFTALMLFSGVTLASERTMSVERPTGESSYFYISIQDSGMLNGSYPGWCADWATRIEEGKTYNAKFYSSYAENLPEGVVDRPENLDEMNWLLNQHPVGETSPSGLGVYTTGDVQLAIWSLIDDSFDSSTVGPFSQARVDELVTMSLAEGSGFVPNCKQIVGILLDPTDPDTGTSVQSTVTEVPRSNFPKCVIPEGDETPHL
jgi:hypothetical protein